MRFRRGRWSAGAYRWSFTIGVQIERQPISGGYGWWVVRFGPLYIIRDDSTHD